MAKSAHACLRGLIRDGATEVPRSLHATSRLGFWRGAIAFVLFFAQLFKLNAGIRVTLLVLLVLITLWIAVEWAGRYRAERVYKIDLLNRVVSNRRMGIQHAVVLGDKIGVVPWGDFHILRFKSVKGGDHDLVVASSGVSASELDALKGLAYLTSQKTPAKLIFFADD
jgi:hypothetical protein